MIYCVKTEAKAADFLIFAHDGPVTDFVLIARALEAAASNRFPTEELANALWGRLGGGLGGDLGGE